MTIGSFKRLMSFYVVSLFTSLPVPFTVSVVWTTLETDENLSKRTNISTNKLCCLMEFCLNVTYFIVHGAFC